MKKIIFAFVAATVAVPALAQEPKVPQGKDAPAVEMQRDHKAFNKAREEHKAQLEATKQKMEKLVGEYNKLKEGKKKDAKRAEIEKEVSAIHDKQLEFKREQLGKFEERLARMKAELAKEDSAEGKEEWVNQKTNALLQSGGDVKFLFEPERIPHGGFPGKRPHMGKGPQGPRPDEDPAKR